MHMFGGKLLAILILCLVSIGFIGCALGDAKEIRSGASIIGKGNDWKIAHGHENIGGEKMDMLESKNMTVWIRFARVKDNTHFRITTNFMKLRNPVEFSPSRITLKLSNGDILRGKAVSCDNPQWDLESLRLYSPVGEPIHIAKDEKYGMYGKPCYSLFFNRPAPPVEEEFIMLMNDAFTSNGVKIDIPPIYFRKTVDHNFRFGLFQ